MNRGNTLSEQVCACIEALEGSEVLSPEERAEEKRFAKVVKALVDDIIASREMLTENRFIKIEEVVKSHPELINNFLNERFTREVIDAVPGYVRRTMQLSRLEGARIPSKITNTYLREAVRTYVLGLPQASISLSRAALEQAIKENLGYQGSNTMVEMSQLLDEAETAQIIDKPLRKMVRDVANQGNNVLHQKPSTLDEAFEVLLKLRGILQDLYAE